MRLSPSLQIISGIMFLQDGDKKMEYYVKPKFPDYYI